MSTLSVPLRIFFHLLKTLPATIPPILFQVPLRIQTPIFLYIHTHTCPFFNIQLPFPHLSAKLRSFVERKKGMPLNQLLNAIPKFRAHEDAENGEKHNSQHGEQSGPLLSHNGSSSSRNSKITGTVVLVKKNVLGYNDFRAGILDRIHGFQGKGVFLQLVSAIQPDPENSMKGKLGREACLEQWLTKYSGLTAGDSAFTITFDWDEDFGVPGAFVIRNEHRSEFYLKTVTLEVEGVPNYDVGKITFVCNSWVYPAHCYEKPRMFFSNEAYLPHQTPMLLRQYREEELKILWGDGRGELHEWDRIYDYACYNDLGDPDRSLEHGRPLLGGHFKFPYPRRGRTGRPSAEKDPSCESRLPLHKGLGIYVPRDERFGHLKMKDFLAYSLNALAQSLLPELKAAFDKTPNEFDSFEDVLKLYEGGIELPPGPLLEKIMEAFPFKTTKEDGVPLFKLPLPQVIKEDRWAWRTDEEFAREMLAGVNPVIIRRLEEFPPVSNLDPKVYGNQNSRITEEHIKEGLDGSTVDEAVKNNKLFILDHHDKLMPYLRKINTTTTKTYATRTILLLNADGTLKPLAIELSLPHSDGDHYGAISKVYTPAHQGVEGSIWLLAKAYVAVNDSGYHQLISHWLNTHAVIEPFIIATHRQLSVLHPIHKLLHPHFRDTMNINAYARATLINANGILENTVFPGKYALEMSSQIYRNWVFTEQALPKDLVKRGMASQDSQSPFGYRLHIEDYPYAVDGLEIWSAIETWVKEYCSFYYECNDMILEDKELQSWWKEVRETGHGDLKDESWWLEMKTLEELIETCTIIIWLSSAFHAAVNFGQYPFAGYLPNRPTISRQFMPEPGSLEYEELELKPDTVFLKTITSQFQTLLGVSLIEVLSRHASDEVYLGQRENPEWTSDKEPLQSFERFNKRLRKIEENIMERNTNGRWKNRVGPVKVPYMLLYPTGDSGLTGKGIPNSISI